MPSRRVPASAEPNRWWRALAARRAAGATLLDLSESNPVRVGLGGAGAPELEALADPRGARYEPNPRGLPAARAAVAAYCAARGGRTDPEDIVLTTGTSESYVHLFRLLADPGEVVLAPSPSYPLFEPLAALEGVQVAPYRLAYDGGWHLDLGALEEALAMARAPVRAAIVVQPNHPTGSCLDAEELRALEDLCAPRGIALIADEVFGDYPWAPGEQALPSLLGERRVPTFVLGGLSKCCGMPQLKLGWIAAAGPRAERRGLLEGLEWIADLFLSVSTPVQLALPGLLGARHRYQADVRARLSANLSCLDGWLASQREAGRLRGAGGWAAIVRLPARRSGEEWALALLERDVVAHPGHFYDLEGEAYLVFSLIPEPAVFRAGLERLGDLLATP